MTRPRQQPPPEPLITVTQAARLLGGVSRDYIYQLIYSGQLACVRLPSTTGTRAGRILIRPAVMDRFIKDHEQPAAGHPARTARGAA